MWLIRPMSAPEFQGLMVAYKLSRLGYQVTLLEATDRVGSFLHGSVAHPLQVAESNTEKALSHGRMWLLVLKSYTGTVTSCTSSAVVDLRPALMTKRSSTSGRLESSHGRKAMGPSLTGQLEVALACTTSARRKRSFPAPPPFDAAAASV